MLFPEGAEYDWDTYHLLALHLWRLVRVIRIDVKRKLKRATLVHAWTSAVRIYDIRQLNNRTYPHRG